MHPLVAFKTKFPRYIIAALLFGAATAIHLQFKSLIGGKIFLFFYPCVFLGALFGGLGPGLLSTVLASGFVWHFFISQGHPGQSPSGSDLLDTVIFALTCILFSVFSGIFHSLRKKECEAKNVSDAINQKLKIASDDALAVVDSNPIPLLVINSDLRVRMANKAFYERFQVTPEEVEERPIAELGTGQWHIPALMEVLNRTLIEGMKFQGFEVKHDFPSIGHRFMILNAINVRLPGSGANVAILAIEDFTERRNTERQLKASEEKYRNLVTCAYDGIMVIRRDGKIEFANHQTERVFGYDPGELLNKQYDILISDRDRKKHARHHDHYMEKPATREMGKGLDLVGKRKDGTEFPIDVSLSPFKSNSDTLVNCMVRDITAQKKVEEERKRLLVQEKALREEAVHTNRVKDEFLSTLSHELRTPLTTILGWSQELLSKNNLTEEVKSGLSVIERSAQVQGQLINDLLDVSKIQSGKMPLDIRVIDLIEVLRLAVASARILAEKKSLELETELPTVPYKVSADACRLQQVFWNLLTNAIKFTPTGGKISVRLDIADRAKRGKLVRVHVADTGIGIKSEFLGRMFERFSQADSSMTRIYGGLGLGLAIVKSLVEMQNGTVRVESDGEGKGATFIVTLPLVLKSNKIADQLVIDKDPVQTLSRLDNVKVLVVDDSADNRYLFSAMLKSLGADVRLAESAKEGLKALIDLKPDILLSDISMPDEDGFSLIRKVRALESDKIAKIPAVALTAYAGAEDVRSVIEAGFSAHIAKPVPKAKLANAISKLVKPSTHEAAP